MESGEQLEVSPDYLRTTYRERVQAHLAQMRRVAAGCGAEHALLVTDEPLDQAFVCWHCNETFGSGQIASRPGHSDTTPHTDTQGTR